MKPLLCCAALALLLSACSDDGDEDEHPAPDKPPRYMIYSPNGEPLNGGTLGKPTCAAALGGWFDRTGVNGAISESVFIRDAKTQFARMDIDHNGYIVSEELDRFRAPYRQPEAYKEAAPARHDRPFGHFYPGHSDPSHTMADPVMSADTNLDFKVTQEEFILQVHQIFARLDANHDGLLSRPEAVAWCEQVK